MREALVGGVREEARRSDRIGYRQAWAEVDLSAVAHNVRLLRLVSAPAELCAVVKADGYGHGSVVVARAALGAGASVLAVALVEEGLLLRDAGIDAPILLLSEPSAEAIGAAVAAGITPTVYTEGGIVAARRAASVRGSRVGVHLKLDTGMHRVGADPDDAVGLSREICEFDDLELEGLWTHLAVADDPDDPFTALQLDRFTQARRELADAGFVARVHHAANSAGAIAHPASRLDLVRTGIALYGYLPGTTDALEERWAAAVGEARLRPVLALKARVHLTRALARGERPSYGRRDALLADTIVATVPLGYADGVPRLLGSCGGSVLIGGRRRPIIGAVTMDQLIVDVGTEGDVDAGDEVVLLGRQGNEAIGADEWAALLGATPYEVLCGIGPRVPRVVV